MVTERQYEIFASLHEESNASWVWLGSVGLPSRTIVKMDRGDVHRVIWCQARIIDQNFLSVYNCSGRKPIGDPSSALVISEWYRDKLKIPVTGMKVPLKICEQNNLWGELGL